MEKQIVELPPTVAQLPFYISGRFPRPDLLGRSEGEGITHVGGRELIERVRDVGLGLQSLGLAAGERVALLAESRPEWLIEDFAIQASAGVTVPIYPTLSAEQVGYILRDCGAMLAIASNVEQLRKVLAVAPTLPNLRAAIVTLGERADVAALSSDRLPVYTLAEIAERGHQAIRAGWGVGREFQDRAKRVLPEDLATIIYTSGTTGEPKGVLLTHANLIANLEGILQVFIVDETDVALSFLPLCHGFERIVSYTYLSRGVSMIFTESLDTIARDLKRVRPTVMTGVPRVYEKLYARIQATGREGSGVKRAIFAWANRVAEKRGDAIVNRGSVPPLLALQARIADRLVFRKIREAVGGRMRFAVSGSAPLGDVLGRWFLGVGIPLIEGYGLTETSPVLCVMPLEAIRFGTVGPPLPNVQLRIAEDGEILARGPNVMRGYHNRPDDTAAVMKDGWFSTGDIGQLDERGYLRITDRKKELLVTSGGKKIAPAPIEALVRAHPLVGEVVLVGDKRHFPAAIIVPDFAALATKVGVAKPADAAAAAALVARDDVKALYAAAIDAVNAGLAQYERIKKFHLLPKELTLDGGELTPTLKVKRRVIDEKYRAEIEAMYRD